MSMQKVRKMSNFLKRNCPSQVALDSHKSLNWPLEVLLWLLALLQVSMAFVLYFSLSLFRSGIRSHGLSIAG